MRTLIAIITCVMITASCGLNKYMIAGFKINDIKKNDEERNYKNILIFGYGPAPTRLFSEQLSSEIVRQLHKKHIVSSYYFLGNVADSVRARRKRIISSVSHDAVMEIIPADTAKIRDLSGEILTIPINIEEFKQKIIFVIYDNMLTENSLWSACLQVKINSVDELAYRVMADNLLRRMRKNRLIED